MNKVFSFLSEVKVELSKVTWPKKEEVIKLTAIILIVCLIVGSFVGAIDFGLTKALESLLAR